MERAHRCIRVGLDFKRHSLTTACPPIALLRSRSHHRVDPREGAARDRLPAAADHVCVRCGWPLELEIVYRRSRLSFGVSWVLSPVCPERRTRRSCTRIDEQLDKNYRNLLRNLFSTRVTTEYRPDQAQKKREIPPAVPMPTATGTHQIPRAKRKKEKKK